MLRSRYFWKLFAGQLGLVALTAAVIATVGSRRIEELSRRTNERALGASAAMLADIAGTALPGGDANGLQERTRRLGSQLGWRLTVVDLAGRVLADSDEDPRRMEDHGQRAEIRAVLGGAREGVAVRDSRTLHRRMLYVARPIHQGDRLAGAARAAFTTAGIADEVTRYTTAVLTAGATAILLAAFLAWLLARHQSGRLRRLKEAAQAITDGRYDTAAAVDGYDDFGALARAINTMAAQTRDRLDAMQQEQTKLSSILGSMVEGVVATDHEERIVHINDVAARILGVPAADAMGRPLWEVTRFPRIGDSLDATLRSGHETEAEIAMPDIGKDRIVMLQGSALRDRHGEIVGAVLVLHDVSELRQLEKMRRDFVSNVSHELKTPLTAIRGLVETMVDDPEMSEETRSRFLARLRDQSDRLSALVSDVLHLSRVESEAGAIERTPVDFRDPVRESVEHFTPEAEKKRLAIRLDTPSDAVVVDGDHEALRQVVDNLLQNAIKYTPSGGRITVQVSCVGSNAVLEVTDNGVGIEPRHLGRIFERFYRADKARSRELGGTGLGLSIVKHVALAHGGQVAVESEPGRGSTFRVVLPLGGTGARPAASDQRE